MTSTECQVLFLQDDDPIYRYPFSVQKEGDISRGVGAAISEFRKAMPDVSLFDVSIRIENADT